MVNKSFFCPTFFCSVSRLNLRSLTLLCLLAIFAMIASAQQPVAPAPTDPAKNEKGQEPSKPSSIKGRVTGADGQPMANIPVFVFPVGRAAAARRPGAGPATQTITDDDGNFEFTGLTPASYAISASAPGYVTPPPDDEDSAGVYRLGDFASVTLVKGGVITGKVTNAAGEPLTGVSVNAIRVGDVNGEADTAAVPAGFARNWRTDDLGVYRIYGLVPGSYIVQAGQAGGRTGAGPNFVSPFSGDAPTFYPSSAREAAVTVLARAGEEVAGIDIRYRGEKGRVVSGRALAKTGADGARPNQTQITLSYAGSDAVVATTFQTERGANRGFAFHGVPDGEYEVAARRGGGPSENDSVSTPRHVTVRGADVGGVELALAPLASLAGRVVVEKKEVGVCQSQRASSIEEILVAAERDEPSARAVASPARLASNRPSAPNTNGEFLLRNLEAGRYRLLAELPDENWYVRAMSLESKPPQAGARRVPAPAPTNVARNGVAFKAGDKVTGLTITVSEGAASLSGKVVAAQGQLTVRMRAHLIPAEKEAVDEVLRYAQANAASEGAFVFKHIAPGRYYLLAKPITGEESGAAARLQAWDNLQRAALRKEAEAAGNVVELQPCQRINDQTLSFSSKRP
jgi:protocatechuate 3,4-dioxygenase beta subunit